MSFPIEVLEAESMKLTPEERARLADRLIASLSDNAEIDEAWATEVERRIAEIESGRANVVPAAEAIARARDALK
jgi:putative addiction module component (TIGR02574 family)